ncbi:MAG: GNAT family N-acetyltransferase [Planctomycetota bacterium]|jgi:GNAT superfamily N-acetyltransferase
MTQEESIWFLRTLPEEEFPVPLGPCKFVDAETEEGLRLFARIHAEAYGEAFSEKDLALYHLDLEDGVIERDKTLVLFVAEDPRGCVSYLAGKKPDGSPFLSIGNGGVVRSEQGKGFGKVLYASVLNRLIRRYGPGTPVLGDLFNGNEASKRILLGLGFERVEREDWFPPEAEDLARGLPPGSS